MKIIKIIMATTADGLINERKELGDYIRTLNDHYHSKGIYFRLDNLLDYETEEERNQEVCDSEFFYIIFSDEVDDDIVKKFDVALQQFKKKDTPRIYTYFQKLPDRADADESVTAFMKKLDQEIGHYYSIFMHPDSIKLNMLLELTRTQELNSMVDVRDGKAIVDGKEMLPLKNIPLFQNNEAFQNLLIELDELRKKQVVYSEEYKKDSANLLVREQLSMADNRIKSIVEQTHRMEKDMLMLCSTIVERNSSGKPLSWREKEASKFLDEGNYEKALNILRDAKRAEELKQAEDISIIGKEEIIGFINEDKLRIKILAIKGDNRNDLIEINECYEECEKIVVKHLIETGIIYDYAEFLYRQNKLIKALEKLEWLGDYYNLEQRNRNISENEKSDYYSLLGNIALKLKMHEKAELAYKKAIECRQKLATDKSTINLGYLAESYSNMGSLLSELKRYEEAEEFFEQAIIIWKQLTVDTNEEKAAYEKVLAGTYNNLGNLLYKTKCYEKAEIAYWKSIEINEKLFKKKPLLSVGTLVSSYINLGTLLKTTRQFKMSEIAFEIAIDFLCILVKYNPSVYEIDLARAYLNYGNLLSNMKRYPEAEEVYKNACVLWQKLAKEPPEAFEDELAATYNNMGALLCDMKKYDEAMEVIQNSIAIRKRLVLENPSVFESGLAASYNNLGLLSRDLRHYNQAIDAFKKAIAIRKKLATDNPDKYEVVLAESCNNLKSVEHLISQAQNRSLNNKTQNNVSNNQLFKAATQGDKEAQFQLGIMYMNQYNHGVEQSIGEATKWINEAAIQGHANAQLYLGYMYEKGQGIQKDDEKAIYWYTKAAEQGNATAQSKLGDIYKNRNNYDEAIWWYSKASVQGDDDAYFNLGEIYSAKGNIELASLMYKSAAEQGNEEAKEKMKAYAEEYYVEGKSYFYGTGGERNYSRSKTFFQLAAEQGHPDSQYYLGIIYKDGKGVKEDSEMAKKYFRMAAVQGHKNAKDMLGKKFI